MRIKITEVTLSLGECTASIYVCGSPQCIGWQMLSPEQSGTFPISKLLTPPDIDQLAYDLYKTLANVTGPVLITEWPDLWMQWDRDDRNTRSQAYDEYSRVRMVLDTIVKSYR